VSDNGRGISAQFLPHVFERFRQEDSARVGRDSGLGLGLAIVRYLVEKHGGQIRAESDGEGKGATFTIALPLEVEMDSERNEQMWKKEKRIWSLQWLTLFGMGVILFEKIAKILKAIFLFFSLMV
jgi:hypothetical protein